MITEYQDRQKLTAIVTCFNEEKIIESCLKSLTWADEILVVDSFSTDGTLEIAKKYADRTLQHEYLNPAAQKNWIIPKAKYDWILILDSDEKVSVELSSEIRELLRQNPPLDGYWIFRNNYLMGKRIKYSGWGRDSVLRLFRKDLGRYNNKRVHEEIILNNTGTLEGRLEHDSISSIADWILKINRYSSLKAKDKFDNREKYPLLHLVFRPPLRFVKDFIFRLGILDGWRGFLIASMSSFAELVMAAKLIYKIYQKSDRQLTG